MRFFKKIFGRSKGNKQKRAKKMTYYQRQVENYLNQATDLYDLERRERRIERNEMPFFYL